MIIKIDCRENDLIKEIEELKENNPKFNNIQIKIENLPLGDIIIYKDDNTELIIIERKTLKDLAASIRDGRYSEQGHRLTNCNIHNHHIFYLIEGDVIKYKSSNYGSRQINQQAILSALTSITCFKGFSLYKSISIKESALWILQMTEKIERTKEEFYYNVNKSDNENEKNEETEMNEMQYASVVSRVKKNNITKNNICAIMLSQIPGVSSVSALAICDKYKTMESLVNALKENHMALSNITTTTKTGNKRRLTKTCINNIHNFLLLGAIDTITIENE